MMNDGASLRSDRIVRADVAGTAAFVVAAAIATPMRDDRWAQILIGATSMVLFAVGAFTGLYAYVGALERSRTSEVGVANLYLLTGTTAPKPVKRTMSAMLAVQVVVAVTAASIGASGLSRNELNALAFGILVPMFGIGMNGLWALRHGRFGPRLAPPVQPSKRKIG